MNNVLSAVDVGLNTLHGIVFGRWHLFQRCGVDHVVHTVHRLDESIPVAHVTQEKSHAALRKILLHFELLELITGINDELPSLIALQNRLDVLLAEGTGAAGNQDRFVVEHDLKRCLSGALGCMRHAPKALAALKQLFVRGLRNHAPAF